MGLHMTKVDVGKLTGHVRQCVRGPRQKWMRMGSALSVSNTDRPIRIAKHMNGQIGIQLYNI